jgi:hypothetical protein
VPVPPAGAAPAGEPLKEAVGAITVIVKSDPELSGGEIVSLIERLWPALQDINTSSGAICRSSTARSTIIPY